MDGLLFKNFGFHIFEPISKPVYSYKAKPVLNQLIKFPNLKKEIPYVYKNTPLPPKGKKNTRRLLDPIPTKEYKGERSAGRTDGERRSKNSSQIRSQRENINRSVPARTYESDTFKGKVLTQRKRVYNEVTPELGATLRLEIVKYPFNQRDYVQEIAEVLEEVLLAAEKGATQLLPRKKFGFHNHMNKAMLLKKQKDEDSMEAELK